jgi:hypothetical protein
MQVTVEALIYSKEQLAVTIAMQIQIMGKLCGAVST